MGSPRDASTRRSLERVLAPLLLVLVVVAVHWPPADAEFAYDDRDLVETNQAVRSLGGGLAGFALPFPPEQPERALYRPLTQLTYAVDHALFGMQARGFHWTNVLLYALTCLGVLRLAELLLGSRDPALAVAFLWALHPVHGEAVDAVAGRSELLALAFGLASFLWFLRRDDGRLAWTSAGFYALACLSKETGVMLLGVLAAAAWVRRPPPRNREWLAMLRPLAPHVAVLAIYLTLRIAVLGQFSPDTAILRDYGPGTRLLTAAAVFAENLRLLFFPAVLQPDFYYQAAIGIVERPGPRAVLGLLAAAAALLAAGRLAWVHAAATPGGDEATDRERAAALVGFALFFAFLLPTSHLLDVGALLAERFLFAPSLGFVLLVVIAGRRLLARLSAPPALGTALVALLAVGAAARSQARAVEWRDEVRLWESAARFVERDVRIHANLAAAYLERGDATAAAAEIERALAIDPQHVPSLGNRGVLELEQGRLEAAETTYQEILVRQPDDFLTWYNLGRVALRRGDCATALDRFEGALERNPNHAWSQQGLVQARAACQSQSVR